MKATGRPSPTLSRLNQTCFLETSATRGSRRYQVISSLVTEATEATPSRLPSGHELTVLSDVEAEARCSRPRTPVETGADSIFSVYAVRCFACFAYFLPYPASLVKRNNRTEARRTGHYRSTERSRRMATPTPNERAAMPRLIPAISANRFQNDMSFATA